MIQSTSHTTSSASRPMSVDGARRSREFALVAAACCWPPSPARDEAARRVAGSGDIDWAKVLRHSRRHRVEPLVLAALKAASIKPEATVLARLSARALNIAIDNVAKARETVRLNEALSARGMKPVFLKGATLAMIAYGSLSFKQARDIDILIKPTEARDALTVLRNAGYEIIREDIREPERFELALALLKECELRHSASGILVELHWRLFDVTRLLPGLHDADRARRAVPMGAALVPTFEDADLFSYLCVHGARHGWARLKWLADLNALLAGRSPIEIERLHAQAVARGAGRTPTVALLLCQDLFGLALTDAVTCKRRSDRAVRWLLAVAMDLMVGADERELDARPWAVMRLEASQLLLGVGWMHLAAVIGRPWSGTHERFMLPLPRPLRFLYGFMRPPLWVARRAKSLARRRQADPVTKTRGKLRLRGCFSKVLDVVMTLSR